MYFRRSLIAIALLAESFFGAPIFAHTTTLAITGGDAVGVPMATWNELSAVTLNKAGAVAFAATLEHSGGIDADNDTGVWLFDSTGNTLLARTGVGNVPGAPGASFHGLERASLSNSGEVAFLGGTEGDTTTNSVGIWRYGNLGGSLLARTGAGVVPDIPNALFSELQIVTGSSAIAIANDGHVPVVGQLAIGSGGVLSSNDRGLWSYSSNTSALIAREGSLNVPDVLNASFNRFDLPAVNSNDQLSVLASMKTGGGVILDNALGIWRYTGSSGELLARSGVGNVPGVAGSDFSSFDPPRLNDLGQVALSGGLSSSEMGVWLYTGTNGALLARSGAGNVPDVPGADFALFTVKSINESGQVLVAADLEPGVVGVTSGLWLLNGHESLIAHTFSGNVPGVPGANFVELPVSALNENGQVAFAAELQMGAGDVDSTNDTGIWMVDPQGDSWLVAREGDLLEGHTIASLNFVGDSESQSSGFNDAGELAFQATFTDGDSGLFLFRPYAADFDRDGDVDEADLAEWETAFADTSTADADTDGDVDGADFLIWQREFGSGVPAPLLVAVVAEPTSGLLLIMGLLGVGWGVCRRR